MQGHSTLMVWARRCKTKLERLCFYNFAFNTQQSNLKPLSRIQKMCSSLAIYPLNPAPCIIGELFHR
jgi:hypothetical protein